MTDLIFYWEWQGMSYNSIFFFGGGGGGVLECLVRHLHFQLFWTVFMSDLDFFRRKQSIL